jgi:hypothetical protein
MTLKHVRCAALWSLLTTGVMLAITCGVLGALWLIAKFMQVTHGSTKAEVGLLILLLFLVCFALALGEQ